ncbi:MAG: type II toxin-antitoxin system PemK/MazF family toxin [bacterium]|nr:type II toxin-antitoxin system PemK/MazF family toxin [bacterium]
MKRGEIWWTMLPEPVGRRPVLLLSRNRAYEVRNAITVAEITRTIRKIPVEVELGRDDGMPKKCAVNLDTIMTVPKTLIQEYITTLSCDKMEKVDKAIEFALGISLGDVVDFEPNGR